MSTPLDHFVVANPARIPCTIRTLRPFNVEGDLKPWCHSGELIDAVLYLARRAELPATEIDALKEQLERLSSLLTSLSVYPVAHPGNITNIKEP